MSEEDFQAGMPSTGETVRLQTPAAPIVGTPGNIWRKQSRDGEWYRLPTTQNLVKLRRPSLQALAAISGNVPNKLSSNILRFIAQNATTRDPLGEWTADKKNKVFQENAQAFLEICKMALVFPQLSLDGEPDYDADIPVIVATDLPDSDILWIVFSFVEGDAGQVESFRAEKSPSV